LQESEWGYFFHGLECDLTNGTDGRFLRLDFGPRGRKDTFTAWGILQFLLTSVSPWKEFAALKAYFGEGQLPFNPYSGSLEKFAPVWDRLTAAGAFEKADPSLLALESKYTFRGSDGLATVRFPPEIPEETILDCMVARRERLSPHARQLLEVGHQIRSESIIPAR
jgi:hypothetical protein